MPLQRKPKLNQTTKPQANSHLFFLICILWVLRICTASAQVSSTVTLAWNPSADPNLAGYRIYQGAASHTYTNVIQVGPLTNATLSALKQGATYFFAVTAYDNIGLESAFSNEISYSAPTNSAAQSLADSDEDGLSKLMEYAVGTDPANPGDATAGISTFLTPVSGKRYLAMKFKRRSNAASLLLQYLPEVSGDNKTWSSDTTNVLQVSVTPLDAQFDSVIVRDLTPTTLTSPRAIRLRVVQN